MKAMIFIIIILATLVAAEQPDVVIDKRFVHSPGDSLYDWMIDSVSAWSWGIGVEIVDTGNYFYPTTKVAIINWGRYIDSISLDDCRENLHSFVADGGRLLVPLEWGPIFYELWQEDCNRMILGTGWRLGMSGRSDTVTDSLTGITLWGTYYPSGFLFAPPLDSILAEGVDSLLENRGPSVEVIFPAESLLIGNPSTYVPLYPSIPIALGARSFYGLGEVITFENNMFAMGYSLDSLHLAFFETMLYYNKPFFHNLFTTPVQPHEERVFRGVPFLLHTQVDDLEPVDLFDDTDFFPAWIDTLYIWERKAMNFGWALIEFLPYNLMLRFIATPGGDLAVGPVTSDLDMALKMLVFGEQETPSSWRRFLSESDRLHAPWIFPEPSQTFLGIALTKEIEHLAKNGHIDDLIYLPADDCTDSLAVSLSDSTVLGFENRPYTFENRTEKPIWLLSSAIKHYRGPSDGYGTSCWWETRPISDRPDWEYRRRGNLIWSPLASDDMADTSGYGARGFELHWSGDSASAVSYTGHFVSSGAGTLLVDGSPIAHAMPDTTHWCATDYWHSDFEMRYWVNNNYFNSELRMAISADSIWTNGIWESPGGIGGNPEPLILKLSPGTTTFPGGGNIAISPTEINVYSGDSSAFVIHSIGPETLHVGLITASILDISPKHDIVPPGDSIVFWVSYDGIAYVHDTILIYSDDPQTPVSKVFATAYYGIDEEYLPRYLDVSVFPNPFNSAVSISAPDNAIIEIYDVLGQSIDKLPGGDQVWKPEASVGSGVYLVRAKMGDKDITKRVVYLK
jgi:hypothetical protein